MNNNALKFIFVVVFLFVFSAVAYADVSSIALQDVSVTVHGGNKQGSGVIITKNNTNYVLTAAHIISHLKQTSHVIENGQDRIEVTFPDVQVVKEIYSEDHKRSIAKLVIEAEVVRFSDENGGDDLALLKLRGTFTTSSAKFLIEDKLEVGTELYHVGSMFGQMGSNSLLPGVISQRGRVLDSKVFDQTNCGAVGGSSGGGLFRKSDGLYIGMLVRSSGVTFNWYVPMDRILAWAKRSGIEFLFNENVKSTAMDKTVIELVNAKPNQLKKYPFLIYSQPKDEHD